VKRLRKFQEIGVLVLATPLAALANSNVDFPGQGGSLSGNFGAANAGVAMRVQSLSGGAQAAGFGLKAQAPAVAIADQSLGTFEAEDRVVHAVWGFGHTRHRDDGGDDGPGCKPPSAVPEPGTFGLLGTGLMVLGGIVRRRAKIG
jgi:hypothetical protein